MQLTDYLGKNAVNLDLSSTTKDDVLRELIGLIDVDEKSAAILFKMLKRRENLGSTGIGRGIAIPHCRALVVDKLKLAYGRARDGVEFRSVDGQRARHFFLIVAPPLEISNDYLPVLGRIAAFANRPGIAEKLAAIQTADELSELLK